MDALPLTDMVGGADHTDKRSGNPGKQLYTPRPYENNKDIKGVYNYVTYTLQPDTVTWDQVALRFCSEELGLHNLHGRGSVRMACKLVQQNWSLFILWAKKTYTT